MKKTTVKWADPKQNLIEGDYYLVEDHEGNWSVARWFFSLRSIDRFMNLGSTGKFFRKNPYPRFGFIFKWAPITFDPQNRIRLESGEIVHDLEIFEEWDEKAIFSNLI